MSKSFDAEVGDSAPMPVTDWRPPSQPQAKPSAIVGLLSAVLDAVDYGLMLVTEAGHVLHANWAAFDALSRTHPLRLRADQLSARCSIDEVALRDSLRDAGRGRRRLLTLDPHGECLRVAVVPLMSEGGSAKAVLLLFGKHHVSQMLSIDGFARASELTDGETKVLQLLADGLEPRAVARSQGVAITTVRSQILSIRAKTRSSDIRDLLHQVAILPPIVSALRRTVGQSVARDDEAVDVWPLSSDAGYHRRHENDVSTAGAGPASEQ